MKEIKTIAVHDGSFHADDVFAVAILKLIYPNIQVFRTRDVEILKNVSLRLDVGLKYNVETLDFDHHQSESVGIRDNGIPYASAGLIWKHFYKYLVNTKDEYLYIDEKLIQSIDADDVGFEICESKISKPYTLSMLISAMNPDWQDKVPKFDRTFEKAVKLAMNILKIEIKKVKGKEKAIKILQSAIIKNKNGNYLILNKLVPWKNYLVDTNIIYVIYESINGNWHVQGVPSEKDNFAIKKDFPKNWGGLNDNDLVKKTGVGDAVFCHRNLFLCGAKSKEGAIKLVKLALKN